MVSERIVVSELKPERGKFLNFNRWVKMARYATVIRLHMPACVISNFIDATGL